jgi:hypothetical protein
MVQDMIRLRVICQTLAKEEEQNKEPREKIRQQKQDIIQ